MRIRWDEIPEGGLSFTVEDGAWFPANEIVGLGPGACTVSLEKNEGRVLLAGTLRIPVGLECDRCLESFSYVLNEQFEVVFELANEEDAGFAQEHFCRGDELDVVYLVEPVIDVFSVLTQQVFLGLPEKRLCSEKCLGLCPECGANLNTRPCGCVRNDTVSPFSVLAKLKAQ